MGITLTATENGCLVVFEGDITCEHARALEDKIIDALRRYRELAIDLSAIREIDVYGLHLVGLLSKVGGTSAVVVADSPVVHQATQRLLKTSHGAPRSARSEWFDGRPGGANAAAAAAQLSL